MSNQHPNQGSNAPVPPDFRALCAELHAAFNTYAVHETHHALLERTRAVLARWGSPTPTPGDNQQ